METLELLANGFATALQPQNLIFAFIGCFIGTLVGVIPGIGPTSGIALLIPMTFYLELTPAIIMLSAIYYGTMYGGTITSILMNVPGCAGTAVTCLEGYPMAKSGRAGAALAMNAIASFSGGTIATFGLVMVAEPLARLALNFGPVEVFALMVMALTMVAGLAGKSMARALVSACVGVLVATVGVDPGFGVHRFTFGQLPLYEGINLVPVVVGLFGLGQLLISAEMPARGLVDTRLPKLAPTRRDVGDSVGPILRGSGLGFFFGIVPGVGTPVPTFLSYVVEKRISKTPEKWGTGMIQGVAGPEAANNACANAALIPLFTLGLPGSATIALLMSAFMLHGVIPGPGLFQEQSELVWAVIASLYIGNIMLLFLNLPLIPMWVSILRIPHSYLSALIFTFIVVGTYSVSESMWDIGWVILFGVMGYVFKKLDIPPAPLVLTLILSKILERSLRRSLQISDGDFSIFIREPISLAFLAFTAIAFALLMLGTRRGGKGAEVRGD